MSSADAHGPAVRPAYRPSAAADGAETGTLLLRDGSRLTLWRALPEDAERLGAFLERLSAEEREEVARSLRLERDDLTGFLERVAEPGIGQAFFATGDGGAGRIEAFGAYRLLEGEDAAALALAVDPERRQRGLATLVLERVAVLAARLGVERLLGVARRENGPLVELFRQGGFEAEERREGPYVSFLLRTRSVEVGQEADRVGARVFTAASLRPLFHPRSVAVVGASRDPTSLGHRILRALIDNEFAGPVYPVNPSADHVRSVRAYPSVTAIGEPVDLAVIAVPARVVPEVVEECGEAGVRALVVITAGFAEVGGEGEARQADLLERIRRHRMRMVGPNCLGLIHADPEVRLNASFAPRMPPSGSVALCSQSGALGVAIIALARRLGLGLSSFVSVGNKADVTGNDLLEYWEEDPRTRIVLFYLESFGNPRRFARLARRVGRSKPIVAVKAGRTQAGSRAAGSHTAALSAADTAVDALFAQTGIVRAETLEEMFGLARALADQPLPRGPRVAVVTNAGGPAILCVDALEASGLRVEPLSDPLQTALREFLPAEASPTNPVDMIAAADPPMYRRAVRTVLSADEVDALVVIYTPVQTHGTAEYGRAVLEGVKAARADGGAGKPVLAAIVGEEAETYALEEESEADDGVDHSSSSRGTTAQAERAETERTGRRERSVVLRGSHPGAPSRPDVRGERIPVFPFPEEIGRVLGKMAAYAEWRASEPGAFPEFADQDLEGARAMCRRALASRGEGWLDAEEARAVLEAAGLRSAPGGVARTPEEAAELADRVGYPAAVKLASVEIVHKTEIGGVVLALEGSEEVREAFERIAGRLEERGEADAMQGVLVQPMLAGTAEVMIGVDHDPVFGPLVAFGLGGIHVEILADVAFRVSPLTDRDAREMVRETRGFRLLEGYRGHPAADVASLEEALLRVSRLVEAVPEIGEMDLNPVFALEPGEGYRVADVRIRVRDAPRAR